MKKRLLSVLLVLCMVFSLMACSSEKKNDQSADDEEYEEQETEKKSYSKKNKKKDDTDIENAPVEAALRPFFLEDPTIYYDEGLVACIEPYSVNDDFSNVVYEDYFRYMFDPDFEYYSEYFDGIREGLIKNNFVVRNDNYDEFFDVYEGNRYNQFPNFITVDSLMHTYHLYFSYLMKNTEKDYLADELQRLSVAMLDEATRQYSELKGTRWETAALKNLEFFYIGAALQDSNIDMPIDEGSFEDAVNTELERINDASVIEICTITDDYEDYTQYKPRGYYEGDSQLEDYFRAMMWYGRIPFYTDNDDLVVCSALIVKGLENTGSESWESIYNVTSFFAGVSDDPGYYEIKDIVDECFGEDADVDKMADDGAGYKRFAQSMSELTMPMVNSVPVMDGEDPVKPCYRFMGQRFTIDASIMQNLVYDSVGEDPSGNDRMLPDTLDVAAALGCETAEDILRENGEFEYDGYTENMEAMKQKFNNDDSTLWNASLYSAWLGTLRPLLHAKPDGYPSYKLNAEWNKKSLETFTGSYAELKHDTILYAKAVMAEMGGGDMEVLDDRGYVDPEPVVYSSFVNLAANTKNGLSEYGMLDSQSQKDLDLLKDIALNLLAISEKELVNEELTDAEYDFIREYGGNIEHFWYEANADNIDEQLVYSYQAPCPVIADIATDPNGSVLEVGSGGASTIYVVFPIDGELHVGSGSVYNFYQFTQPMSDRLTDSEWREMLDPKWDPDTFELIYDDVPEHPEWTQSYRIAR